MKSKTIILNLTTFFTFYLTTQGILILRATHWLIISASLNADTSSSLVNLLVFI